MPRANSLRQLLVFGISTVACGGTTQLDAIGAAREGGAPSPVGTADGGPVLPETGPAAPDAAVRPTGAGLQFSDCPASPDPNIDIVACGLPAEANLMSVEPGSGGPATYWIVHPKGVSSFVHGVAQPGDGTTGWQPTSVIAEASLPSTSPRVLSRYVAKVNPGLLFSTRGPTQSSLQLWNQSNGQRTELATSIEPLRVSCLPPSCSYTNAEDAEKHPETRVRPTLSLIPYVYAGVAASSVTSTLTIAGGQVLAVRGNDVIVASLSVLAVYPPGFMIANRRVGGITEGTSRFVADSTWSVYDLVDDSTSDENGAYLRVPGLGGGSATARSVVRMGFDGSEVAYLATSDWTDTRAIVGTLYGRKGGDLFRVPVGSSPSVAVEAMARGLENMGPVASDGKEVYLTLDVAGSRVLGRLKKRAPSECGACVASGISWKWDGGMRAYYDASEVNGCRAYTYKRYPGGAGPDTQSCTQDLSDCESDWGSADLVQALSHPDVEAAFRTKGTYSFGHDSRPADGAMLMVSRGETVVYIGSTCHASDSACVPVPAGLVKLATVLTGIDAGERARGQCKSTFPE